MVEYDGAEPSYNSISMENLRRLYDISGDGALRSRIDALRCAFVGILEEAPYAMTFMLSQLMHTAK